MRVSRLQAEQNKQKVIDVASQLFREHGFDGIGLKDLMHGAGLTQGAFYKQFASKDDLAAQASARAMQSTQRRWEAAAVKNPQDPLGAVIAFYLNPAHREKRMEGCPIAALGSDAARQNANIRASFETGIKEYLHLLTGWFSEAGDVAVDEAAAGAETSDKAMATLSTMVGALLLARAVNDEQLAGRILQAAAGTVQAAAAIGDAQPGDTRQGARS